MRDELRCQYCGRENMAIDPNDLDMAQCMSCGHESTVSDSKDEWCKWHYRDTSGSGKPDLHRDYQAWKLKRGGY